METINKILEEKGKKSLYLTDRKAYNREWYSKNKERLRLWHAKWQREWRKKNPELAKQKDRKWHQKYKEKELIAMRKYYEKTKGTEEFKKSRNERTLKYHHSHKEQVKAHVAVRGLIKPNKCEKCKKIVKVEGHHPDYKKPLEVLWLCKGCHELIHHPRTLTLTALEKLKINE